MQRVKVDRDREVGLTISSQVSEGELILKRIHKRIEH